MQVRWGGAVLLVAGAVWVLGQSPVAAGQQGTGSAAALPGPASPIERQSAAEIEAQRTVLLEKARQALNGTAGVTFARYPRHYTQLTVRVKSGGAEMHAYWNDIFVVVDGEATEMTGGTIVDASTNAQTGETHGTRLEGAKPTPMHKGDVIHIVPNTPHQTVLEPGKTFTYYVIKIAAPNAPVQ